MTPADNSSTPLRIIGTPVLKDGSYILNEFAILGRECGWICPECNNEVRICPSEAGEHTFTCDSCNTRFIVRVDAEADTFLPSKRHKAAVKQEQSNACIGYAEREQARPQVKPARGMLITPVVAPEASEGEKTVVSNSQPVTPTVRESAGFLQWGGMFSRKKYTLHEGANIIGRKDKRTPSDLEIEDPEMSRRSVRIDVIPESNGNLVYTLTILKSLNPIKINGKAMDEGISLKLRNNDTIVMGKTTLTFKMAK